MADPVAGVEKIVRLGLAIKDAVDTVRHNENECREVRKRVLRFSAILSQLQQAGMMNDNPTMSSALDDLGESLQRALELVTACQERSTIRRLVTAGDMSKQLRRVKDDILNKVMLASFAIHATTIVLLTSIQAAGCLNPLPTRQPEDAAVDISHSSYSADDDREHKQANAGPDECKTALSKAYSKPASHGLLTTSINAKGDRNAKSGSELNDVKDTLQGGNEASIIAAAVRVFRWSELKAATNNFSDGNIVGRGGFDTVYKGTLNDGNMVAIKINDCKRSPWAHHYDQLFLVSKLQHKNIVKAVGYCHKVLPTSVVQLFKHKKGRAKEKEFIWVEEYVSNGSLEKTIHESQLDWSSIFCIIEGIAQGLHYLHEQRIVHLDVKPANILLDFDMNPKLIDFDLAILLDDNDEVTCGSVGGTIGYMAPELYIGSTVSRKTDVYALGITLLATICVMCRSKPYDHVLERAWKAWEAGRIEEEFDPSLFDMSQLTEIKRCVQLGLVCAQPNPVDRPIMADVLSMLNGEKELPTPNNVFNFGLEEEAPDGVLSNPTMIRR